MSRARVIIAAACALRLLTAAPDAAAQSTIDQLTIVAPAAPGGGWDQTARVMQQALEADGLVRTVVVENVPGAAGTIGLSQFVSNHSGDRGRLLITGLVMVGAIVFNDSPVSLVRTTALARLTGEFEVIAVPAASPIRDVRDLVAQLRNEPGSVSWGGGSAGGTDHILAGLVAEAAGVDARLVNYVAFSGGGEAVAAMLGGQLTAGVSGYSEFSGQVAAGRLRVLAISSRDRVPGIDAPTLIESGLDVALANWRGVVAPPGLSDEARASLTHAVERMTKGAAWQRSLRDRGWTDQFLAGEAFERFMDDERVRVTRIARRLRSGPTSAASVPGSLVMPIAVGGGALLVFAGLAVERVRRRRSPDAGEPMNRRAVAIVGAGLLAYLALLPAAGFVIASTLLFWVTAMGLSGRARARDLLVGAAFSATVYLVFTAGLGLSLPVGPFARALAWTP